MTRFVANILAWVVNIFWFVADMPRCVGDKTRCVRHLAGFVLNLLLPVRNLRRRVPHKLPPAAHRPGFVPQRLSLVGNMRSTGRHWPAWVADAPRRWLDLGRAGDPQTPG